jgi:predicted RND superfamily exporter protein
MFYACAQAVIRFRWWVIAVVFLVTGILGAQIRNLHIVVDPNTLLPMIAQANGQTQKILLCAPEQIFSSMTL